MLSLIVKSMQLRPEDRYQTPAETMKAIEDVVGEMTGIKADGSNVEFLLKIRDEESDLLQTWRSGGIRSSAFLGSFRGAELVEFLQMLEFNQKSGTLTVVAGPIRGRMMIHQGRIVTAESGHVNGPRAVGRLLTQQQGDFEFTPGEASGEHEFDLRISQALLNVMRYRDETGRLPAQAPPPDPQKRRKKD